MKNNINCCIFLTIFKTINITLEKVSSVFKIKMSDQIISKEGYEKLNEEYQELVKVKRREIADRIQKAKDMGDLSENAEYSEAKDAQALNEGRIIELDSLLKNVVVVESKKTDEVSLGSVLTVKADGKERTFEIVSFNEVDPPTGKISNESPIGQAFLGKSKGDTVDVQTPRGVIQYKILKIS